MTLEGDLKLGRKRLGPNGGCAVLPPAPKLAAAGFDAFLFSWGVAVKMEYSFKNKDLCVFGKSRISSMGQFIEQILLHTLS